MQVKTTDNASLLADSRAPSATGISLGDKRPDLLRDELLSEIFSTAANRWPTRTAVVCGDKTWTFRALEEDTTAMARGLVRFSARRVFFGCRARGFSQVAVRVRLVSG